MSDQKKLRDREATTAEEAMDAEVEADGHSEESAYTPPSDRE